MKKFFSFFCRKALVRSLYLILTFSVYSVNIATATVVSDSLIQPSYQGFRLGLSNVRNLVKTNKRITFECDIANTGKEQIDSKVNDFKEKTVFTFDVTFDEPELKKHRTLILEAISNLKFRLKPGDVASAQEVSFRIKKTENISFTTNVMKNESSTLLLDNKYCPDLIVDSIVVIKRKKNEVRLMASVKNIGKGPTTWLGDSKELEDNIYINGYLSGTPEISRGSVNLGGFYMSDEIIKNRPKKDVEIIDVGESIWIQLEFDITKFSRYTSLLVLQIDPFLTIKECDRTNNSKFLILDRK